MDTLRFYAPQWDLVLIWCIVTIVACLIVLWIGQLFGQAGVLVTAASIGAAALFLCVSTGHWWLFYLLAFSGPMVFGALLGLLIWYLWLARARRR